LLFVAPLKNGCPTLAVRRGGLLRLGWENKPKTQRYIKQVNGAKTLIFIPRTAAKHIGLRQGATGYPLDVMPQMQQRKLGL
jgi:hypothetical protein